MSEKQQRRQWALEQIADREAEIARLREFIAMLDASDAAVKGNGAAAPKLRKSLPTRKRRRRTLSLADRIDQVLRETDRPMQAADIAQLLEASGYRHNAKNYSLTVAVSSELNRMVKNENRSVARVERGQYRHLEQPQEAKV